MSLHRLLADQLAALGIAGPPDAGGWEQLLARVSATYGSLVPDGDRAAGGLQGDLRTEDLRAVTRAIGDGMLVLDGEARVLSANAPAVELLGWSEEELHGIPILPRIGLAELVLPGPSVRREKGLLTRKDGTLLPVSFSFNPIEGARGAVLLFRDATDVRRSEAQLRRAKQAAEEALRVRSEFLANVNHEIRTPLNAVIGLSNLMLDGSLSERHREQMALIRTSANNLLAMLNDILDFSRAGVGEMPIELASFDLRQTVETALDLVAHPAAHKGLELAYAFVPGSVEWINSDAARIRQVLFSLLNNAVKFTERGAVTVEVESRVLPSSARHELTFTVRDTGVGIAEERRASLFEPFTRGDSSRTRSHGGVGLGLSLSRQIAARLGGELWLESVAGAGTAACFRILADPSEAPPAAAPASLSGRQARLLGGIAVQRRLLRALCQAWGMGVVEEADAECDVVLADSAALASGPPRRPRVPWILLGPAADVARDDPHLFPLAKPVKREALREVLRRALARSETPRPAHAELARMAEQMPLRILVAEDTAINQRVILMLLESMGYRGDVAATGVEVLDALERQAYDVVLMDVQMPQMDGLEATRRLRERFPPPLQPYVIALTAESWEGDRERCLEAGMDAYLAKPVTPRALSEALRACGRGTPAGPDGSLVVDHVYIDDITRVLGKAAQRTLDVFFERAAQLLTDVEQALQRRAGEEVRAKLHALKGISLTAGASGFADRCKFLEVRAKSGSLAGLGGEIAALREGLPALRRVLVKAYGEPDCR